MCLYCMYIEHALGGENCQWLSISVFLLCNSDAICVQKAKQCSCFVPHCTAYVRTYVSFIA